MNIQKSSEFIQLLSDKDLALLCNDIYDYKNGTRGINVESNLYMTITKNKKIFGDGFDVVIDLILTEALSRFHKVAKILMITKPHAFIK